MDADNLLERLRAQQSESVAGQTVEIPVAGYSNPGVIVRYAFLDSDESKKIGKRIRGQFVEEFDRLLFGTIDAMVAACAGIYVRNGTGELEPLDPDGGGPVLFDDRLAKALAITVNPESPARDLVRQLFKGNDYAVAEHGGLFQRWLSDTSIDVSGGTLGDS